MDVRPVKICLLGAMGVGKSSLVLRYVSDRFTDTLQATIGAAFLSKSLTLDGTHFKYQIWDTAGQEKYRSLAPMYYRGAAAVVFVFSISDQASFDVLPTMVSDVIRQANGPVVKILVGNKVDNPAARVVSNEAAAEFAFKHDMAYFECSALNGSNVTNAFEEIARRLPKEFVPVDPHLDLAKEEPQYSGLCSRC